MRQRRLRQGTVPSWTFTFNAEIPKSNLITGGIVKANSQVHIARAIPPIVVITLQLVTNTNRRPGCIRTDSKGDGDIFRCRSETDITVFAPVDRLPIDRDRTDFKRVCKCASRRGLSPDLASEKTENQKPSGHKTIDSRPYVTESNNLQANFHGALRDRPT